MSLEKYRMKLFSSNILAPIGSFPCLCRLKTGEEGEITAYSCNDPRNVLKDCSTLKISLFLFSNEKDILQGTALRMEIQSC